MNTKIEKLKAERDKTQQRISKLQARGQDIERQIVEVENTQIIALVRSVKLGPEGLAAFIRGLREKSEAPAAYEREEEPYEA